MLKSCFALTIAVKSTWEQGQTMLWGVFNVASVPRGTRAAGPGRAQWTALPGAWEGGVPPLLSPASLCINFCLQTKSPQKLQTVDSNPTFHKNLIYGEACQLLAECWSLLCLDQHSSHAAASNLWPKEPKGQGDSNLKVLVKEMMVWQRMAGALGSLGNPDTTFQSSFPRQALPFTEPSTRLKGLSVSLRVYPTWLDELGARTERTQALKLDSPGLDSALTISTRLGHVASPPQTSRTSSIESCGQNSRQCR